MKSKFLLILLLALSACSSQKKVASNYSSFTDDRNGHVYKTVKLGKHTWMAQNLNFKIDGAEYYDRSPANGDIYGMLYSFHAAQSAAPKGWHVPTEAEWRDAQGSCSDFVETLNILFAGEHGGGKFLYMNAKATFYTTTHDGTPVITMYIDKGDSPYVPTARVQHGS